MSIPVIEWFLQGDVSIQYQVARDLLGETRPELQARIAQEGWGAAFLAARRADGSWGERFYQPKWTCAHYTLLDLKNLQVAPTHELIRQSIALIADNEKSKDGGINPARTVTQSDVCVNGMFLSYACYFGIDAAKLDSVVDFVLDQRMEDGGFNCRKNRSGARHSSLHSTICMLEGILEYGRNGYTYRVDEMEAAAASSREFVLQHHLFRSDHTGAIIHPAFLKMSFPTRWQYDIYRGLATFADAAVAWDPRMQEALDILLHKRRADGRWTLAAKHPGQTHFDMEKAGTASRWNTLRALRILKRYAPETVDLAAVSA